MLRSKQSVKISTFKVIVCNPWNDTYEYQWEGKTRATTAWRCVLVSAVDHTEYCNGEYKLTTKNKSNFEKHVKAYQHGTTAVMKAVSLVDDAKTKHNSCSVRVTVNMASTTLSKVLENFDNSAVQPVPKTTVAETTQLQQDQNFVFTTFVLVEARSETEATGAKLSTSSWRMVLWTKRQPKCKHCP